MWKRNLAPAVGLIVLLCADPAVAQSLDGDALLEHGFEIADFKPADAFAAPPDEGAIVGRPFRFIKPLKESESPAITHVIGGWSYDRQKQSLRVAVSTAGWQRTELPEAEADEFMHYGLRVGTRNVSDFMTTAQNAYGAQFEVHNLESQAIHVSPLTRRERAASVDIAMNMFVDVAMPPEEARLAVDGAQVVVEGVLAPVEGSRVTMCYDTGSTATINLRLATLIHTCVMNARITRLAVVTSDGRPLAEWTEGQK